MNERILFCGFFSTSFFFQWQKNLKGLNDEKDFNPEFLFAIFERIEATPFSLDFHGKSEPTVDDAVLTPKQRQVLFHQVYNLPISLLRYYEKKNQKQKKK